MILIVSSKGDIHAQAVERELKALGARVTLVDLSMFPQHGALSLRSGGDGRRCHRVKFSTRDWLDLSECRAVWWRRPQSFELHPKIAQSDYYTFTYGECYEAWTGLWNSLREDTLWVNDLNRDEAAHRKVYQLRVAQDVGLTIPETLVTNDVREAEQFIVQFPEESVIYKAFSATPQHWRETRLLREDGLSQLDNVRFAPVIFQEYIDAVYDVRITVVGDEIFAAAIHSQDTSYKVDFRMDMDRARIEAVELPAELREKLLRLMRHLGLEYGAIDMRKRPDGQWVFLEINPAGQYLFIEQKTNQPISKALAKHLAEGEKSELNKE